MSLRQIGLHHGTDKATHHDYIRWYEQWFEPLRNEPVTVLELGYGGHENPELGGASALMWRDYFPNGIIVVVDIEEKTLTARHEGINFRRGSQADEAFLEGVHAEFGDFDIIIDDASHVNTLCDARQAWLKTLGTFKTFGNGWTPRVSRVRSRALAFARDGNPAPVALMATETAKAVQSDTSIKDILKNPEAWGPISGTVTGVVAAASGPGPMQWALAFGMIVLVCVGVWYFIQRVRKEA